MKIEADLSALKTVKPHEYAIRFLFGGLVTALAGVIAKRFGPGIGGLFLAFPAIFPASATLVEKHEKQKKRETDGTIRGREAAAVDAAGASLGTLGLVAFAIILWRYLPSYPSWWFFLSLPSGGSPSPSCYGGSVGAFDSLVRQPALCFTPFFGMNLLVSTGQ